MAPYCVYALHASSIDMHSSIDMSVLLENTPLIKFTQTHIQDTSGVFSTSSLVKISMTSLISCLTLKLYLNLLVHGRNIFGS